MKKLFMLILLSTISIFTISTVSALDGYTTPEDMRITMTATANGSNIVGSPNTAGNLYFWTAGFPGYVYLTYNLEERSIFDGLSFALPLTLSLKASEQRYRYVEIICGTGTYTFDIYDETLSISNDSGGLTSVDKLYFEYDETITTVDMTGETYGIDNVVINIIDSYYSTVSTDYDTGYYEGQQDFYDNGSVANGFVRTGSYDYLDGITTGKNQMFFNGSVANGYLLTDSFDYNKGLNDIFNNGANAYDLDYEDSYDYGLGYDTGITASVGSASISFMNNFGSWFVPAIIIIILLGGFVTIYASKQRGRD